MGHVHTCTFIPAHIEAAIFPECSAATHQLHELCAHNEPKELRSRVVYDITAPSNLRMPPIPKRPGIRMFDANNRVLLPGVPYGLNEDPIHDRVASATYRSLVAFVDLLQSPSMKRKGIDDKNGDILCTVHYGKNYENAYNDSKRIVVGDGGKILKHFGESLTTIAHEAGHGVVFKTANFADEGQPAAMHECYADIFAACTDQKFLNVTVDDPKATWLIGDELIPGVAALRSMKNEKAYVGVPGLGDDMQPKRMSDYGMRDASGKVIGPYPKEYDNGGAHENGPKNREFYEFATALGGYSWDKPLFVWYETLKQSKPTTDFYQHTDLMLKFVDGFYHKGSAESEAAYKAATIVETYGTKRPSK